MSASSGLEHIIESRCDQLFVDTNFGDEKNYNPRI